MNVQSKPVDAATEFPPYQRKWCPKCQDDRPDRQDQWGVTNALICRGTKFPEEAGRWYERCDLDVRHPHLKKDRHWVDWLHEYPRYAPLKDVTILELQAQLADPTPTPLPSPSKNTHPDNDDNFPLDPALRADVEYLAAGITSLRSQANLGPNHDNGPQVLSQPRSALLHTSQSGQVTSTTDTQSKCTGPLCRGPGTSLKLAKACTFKMCKRCCIYHQSTAPKTCKTHRLDPSSTQATALPPAVGSSSATPVQPGFYDRSKPLTEEHYQLKMAAQAQGVTSRVNFLAEKAKLERQLESQIDILFWDKDGAEPQSFTVCSQDYPQFTLANCPLSLLERLHISPTSDNHLEFIETLDPSTGRWINHQLGTARNIANLKVLLYRAVGVRDGESMITEVQNIVGPARSRKRPVTENDFVDAGAPAHRRARLENSTPTRTHAPTPSSSSIALDTISLPSDSDDEGSPSLPMLSSSSPLSRRSSSPPLPPVHEAFASIRTSSKPSALNAAPVTASAQTIDYTQQPFGHHLDLMPSSRHSFFPLKYVVGMARLFERINSMGSGVTETRFRAAFPLGFIIPSFPRAGYFSAASMWTDKQWEHLKEKYLNGRYTTKGLWKDFVKEINKLKEVNKLKNAKKEKRSQSGSASASAGPSNVKTEPREASVFFDVPEYSVVQEGGKEFLILDD